MLQGNLSRTGPNHEGVHARGDNDRPQVVGGIRASVLQVLGPDQVEQVQEESKTGAVVQQIRRTQRVENIKSAEEAQLVLFSSCTYKTSNLLIT
jgi:hypothetical protein